MIINCSFTIIVKMRMIINCILDLQVRMIRKINCTIFVKKSTGPLDRAWGTFIVGFSALAADCSMHRLEPLSRRAGSQRVRGFFAWEPFKGSQNG